MPRKNNKNTKTSGKKGAATAVLDDDVYGDDNPNVTDSSGDGGNTKDDEQFDFADMLTQLSEMTRKTDPDDIVKMLQKESFELRKNGKIDDAKKLQYYVKEGNREKRDGEKEITEMITQEFFRKSLGIPDEHRTDDGDQSPVHGHYEICKMKRMWCSGMDWNPNNPLSSPWLRCLAAGDYEEMMKFIEQTPLGEIKELIEKRESLLNISALFHVIRGSTMMIKGQNNFDSDHTFCNHSKSPRHVDCFKKLIKLCANVKARDFAGFTPLHYSVTCDRHETTLQLAMLLLENGADPNAKNRLGETPLVQPMMSKLLDCMQLLLDYGCDPTIIDNSGSTCLNISAYDQDMNRLLSRARQQKVRKMRQKASIEHGGILACEVCEKPTKSRCTGCYVARYCSRECQLSHWKTHKKACKENRERFVPVNLKVQGYVYGKSFSNMSVWGTDGKKSEGSPNHNFLVKVQVPRTLNFDNKSPHTDPILVYDKDKNIYGTIDASEPTYQPLRQLVESKGLDGLKGYFLALIDKENHLKINIKDIQLPANW